MALTMTDSHLHLGHKDLATLGHPVEGTAVEETKDGTAANVRLLLQKTTFDLQLFNQFIQNPALVAGFFGLSQGCVPFVTALLALIVTF